MRYGIKKCVLALFLVFAAAFLSAQEGDYQEQAYAEESGGSGELDLSYVNLPIVKIYNHPRGYYILYRTTDLRVGRLYVPWEWIADHRAFFFPTKSHIDPYVSYVTNNGEFFQLRINAPADVRHSTWGEATSNSVPDDNFDVDEPVLVF